MKKIVALLVFTIFTYFSEAKNSVSHIPTLKPGKVELTDESNFQLGLIQYTESCPDGYGGGGVTYWIVYDTNTGTVAGYGAYSTCYPVAYC